MRGTVGDALRVGGMGPGEWLRKAPHKVARLLWASLTRGAARRRDRRFPTYRSERDLPGRDRLQPLLAPLPLAVLRDHAAEQRAEAAAAMEHRFDLLGSGPVHVGHGVSCAGLEGHRYPPLPPARPDRDGNWLGGRVTRANLPRARALWQMVEPPYTPIDWQLDFKSGYRWSEPCWSPEIRIGGPPGADIKVPWELSRMQHLPSLALAHALIREEDGRDAAESLAREFRNQMLDFAAANPPRYGVNWRNAMEAALRVCSWLLAWDLFQAHGAVFDRPFTRTLCRSVHEHGEFIYRHLEWNPVSPESRGNHYLANVVGLLFAGAYLPASRTTDGWLLFASRELLSEIDYQFHEEGSSIEASTSYHRLSTEMALHGTALLLGLPRKRLEAAASRPGTYRWPRRPGQRACPVTRAGELDLPAWLPGKLQRMVAFSAAVRKPDGRAHQMGDNDSGRFLKLPRSTMIRDGIGSDRPTAEDSLDHRHLQSALGGLVGPTADAGEVGGAGLDGIIIRSLSGGRTLPGLPGGAPLGGRTVAGIGRAVDWRDAVAAWERTPEHWRRQYTAGLPPGASAGSTRIAYPAFGIYILRSARLYLGFRCGGSDANHAHNDDLSVELNVEGRDIWADPGSYLYTPLPGRRNQYRSVAAHFAPFFVEEEPARLDLGLFTHRSLSTARCLYFGELGAVGEIRHRGRRILRVVAVEPARVRILDAFPEASRDTAAMPLAPQRPVPFSPGYGKLLVTGDEEET